jgi:dihydrofolate reductase
MQRQFDIVVACCRKTMGIATEAGLPWHIPADLRYFKQLTVSTCNPTLKNAVIMGRKTFQSISVNHRPLPDRLNIVISNDPDEIMYLPKEVLVVGSLNEALTTLTNKNYIKEIENVYVIGGSQVYNDAFKHQQLRRAFVTFVELEPPLPNYTKYLPEDCFDKMYYCHSYNKDEVKNTKPIKHEFVVFETA